jgi:two-component system, chemotaxis family, response regulator Rcp1
MQRKRVLIAEDNEADVFLVRESFREAGLDADLFVVRDGVEAIEALNRSLPEDSPRWDLILLDLNLPKRSGLEVMENARSLGMSDVPILIVSSSESEKDRANTTALGAAAYFTKPSDYRGFLKLGAVAKGLL